MKRYMVCLFLFIGISAACLTAACLLRRQYDRGLSSSAEETAREQAETGVTMATAPENWAAANQQQVLPEASHEEEYYLVSEDGFLLVFGKDQETICLYTHIPLMEFPDREQERLREGIWFPSMMEVIQYLESYTS